MTRFNNNLPLLAAMALAALVMMPNVDAGSGQATLIGWNNLGMHCMDDDYSVFTILPPFNTVDAQLIDAAGKLVLTPAGVLPEIEWVFDLVGERMRG